VGTFKNFQVTDSTGKRYSATLVGTFPPDDLAVIHVEGGRLRAATLGDSSMLHVGDIVLALGNPLGLQSSVTNCRDGVRGRPGAVFRSSQGARVREARFGHFPKR
jgi:S1-C subfamily serine protease